jgi:hypothetical protein
LASFEPHPRADALPDDSLAKARQTVVDPTVAAPAAARAARPARRGGAWEWARAHPAAVAALVYAVLSLAFVGQGLWPGWTLSNSDMLYSTPPWTASVPPGVRYGGANFELADATAVFHSFYEHAAATAPHAPLWNPYIMAGRPFLADAQSAVFSPFTAPVYVLGLWMALPVIAALKLFAAAFGTYLLGRALGMRFGGALLAGVVFAFGTFFVVWLGWPLTNIFPLLPWLLLVTDRLVCTPGLLPSAGLAVLVALAFFGGHPETTFHTMVAVCLFFAWRTGEAWLRAGRPLRLLATTTAAFALALLAGTALAAVMLVPLFELFVHSGDYARRLQLAPVHADPKYLVTAFLFDYWGRPTQTPLVGDLLSNRGFYAGAITLMLAAIGLVLRPTAIRLACAGAALFTLTIVLGAEPLFSIVTALPGFRTAHNTRLVIFILFALALLAGWGLDDLVGGTASPRRRRVALVVAGTIFCAPVAWMLAQGLVIPARLGDALRVAWGFADPPRAPAGQTPPADIVHIVRLSALLQWLVVGGAGLGVIAVGLRRGRGESGVLPRAALLIALAVVILVIDLFRANMGFNPAIPVAHAEQPTTGAIRYLQSRRPNRFAALSRPGIDQPLQPDLAMRYRLYDARGYDYPIERRYDAFWRATAATTGDFIEPTQRAGESRKSLRGLSLLGVTDLLHYPYGPAPRLRGLRLVYSGPDARIYRNPDAVPRAFLVARQRVVRGADAALAATTDPAFDPRAAAVTERRVPGVALQDRAPAHPSGIARLVDYGEEHAVIRATARKSSLLVLTDVHYPGWKASVDGRPAKIERVDYLLRGVRVAPGRHRIEFRYEPVSWRLGWIVSTIALLAVAATAAVGWRRRMRGHRT